MSFLKEITKEEQANILAQYMPSGAIYGNKFTDGSNIRKVLLGLACVWLQQLQ